MVPIEIRERNGISVIVIIQIDGVGILVVQQPFETGVPENTICKHLKQRKHQGKFFRYQEL